MFKATAKGTGNAKSLPSQRYANPREPEVPRRCQSMRRGPDVWGAGQFCRFSEGPSFSKVGLARTYSDFDEKIRKGGTDCDLL